MTVAEAVIIFELLALKGVGRAIANRILRRAVQRGVKIADLSHRDVAEEVLNHLVDAEQLSTLGANRDLLEDQVNQVFDAGGGFLCALDEDYPTKILHALKDNAPPILAYKGNLKLLDEPSVGFCGSRKASEVGLDTGKDCASQIAQQEIVVVSGNAAGIDAVAHYFALDAGGSTILALPEGILRFRIRKELDEVWDWNRALVLSEFAPGITWHSHQAMQRNKTIIGLSDVVIVIEAGPSGGTLDAGLRALEAQRSLFAPTYADMPKVASGNEKLIGLGATALFKIKKTGQANLRPLFEELERIRNSPARIKSDDQIELTV